MDVNFDKNKIWIRSFEYSRGQFFWAQQRVANCTNGLLIWHTIVYGWSPLNKWKLCFRVVYFLILNSANNISLLHTKLNFSFFCSRNLLHYSSLSILNPVIVFSSKEILLSWVFRCTDQQWSSNFVENSIVARWIRKGSC